MGLELARCFFQDELGLRDEVTRGHDLAVRIEGQDLGKTHQPVVGARHDLDLDLGVGPHQRFHDDGGARD